MQIYKKLLLYSWWNQSHEMCRSTQRKIISVSHCYWKKRRTICYPQALPRISSNITKIRARICAAKLKHDKGTKKRKRDGKYEDKDEGTPTLRARARAAFPPIIQFVYRQFALTSACRCQFQSIYSPGACTRGLVSGVYRRKTRQLARASGWKIRAGKPGDW